MIRDTIASDSAFAAVFVTPDSRVCLQYRLETGKIVVMILAGRDAMTLPYWIKLIRQGNTIKAQHSKDSKKWKDLKGNTIGDKDSQPAVIEVEMDEPINIGLVVCSRSGPAIAAEAMISQVSLGGDWSSSEQFIWSEDIGYEGWGKSEEAGRRSENLSQIEVMEE
jgi:hypothetical protein